MIKAIDLSILAIALLIQISIGCTALYKMSGDPDISRGLVLSFVFSVYFACTISIGALLHEVGGDQMRNIVDFVRAVSYGYFFQSLLWTLVIRLHITFQASHYHVTWRMGFVFKVIIFIELIGWIIFSTLFVMMEDKVNVLIPFSLGLFLLFLYIIGSVLAVYSFILKLSKLAQDLESTFRTLDVSSKKIELDRDQREISKLSTKYLMLFAIAMVSTVFMLILSLFVNMGSGLRSPILAVDVCISLLTVHLQFGAMGYHYQKWCGCCDAQCNKVMTRSVQNVIQRHTSRRMSLPDREEMDILDPLNGRQTDQDDEAL